MIKPVLRTLSLSLLFLGAAGAWANEQGAGRPPSVRAATPDAMGCSSQDQVDRGWEVLQQRLAERLAARSAARVEVPGTILSPLFPALTMGRVTASSASATSTPAPTAKHRAGARK